MRRSKRRLSTRLRRTRRRLRRKVRRRIGKVYTKARRLKNNLSKRKLAKKYKKIIKKTVVRAKKVVKKTVAAAKKVTKKTISTAKKVRQKVHNVKKTAVKKAIILAKKTTWKDVASLTLDCIPIIGNAKAAYEATTGKDPITGRKLADWERSLTAAAILAGPVAKVGARGVKLAGKGTNELVTSLKKVASRVKNIKIPSIHLGEELATLGPAVGNEPTRLGDLFSKIKVKGKDTKNKKDNKADKGANTEITIKYDKQMPKREFERKANKLKELGDKGLLYKAQNPVPRNPAVTRAYRQDMIKRIWNQYGKINPEFGKKLIHRVTKRMQPDHVWELQLGGPDSAENLKFLDSFTNWNIGTRQIRPQIRKLPTGTKIKVDWGNIDE
ncbi:pre-toxin TG domain-containing protein [Bacillus sp. Hm123]|uniref:pre-toxin TG domain-containing protein n=1 Tax=Bacillus sp. Hm123 TaxID=3450745 RepID=UPI003F440304